MLSGTCRLSLHMSWLYRPWFDILFILLPPFAMVAWVLLQPGFFAQADMPPWFWLVFVVGVDVSHVYSTLYRTYLHPQEYRLRRSLLLAVPALVWLGGVVLYSLGEMTFWRVMAYLAVYHFVRQQYGFFRLYARHEQASRWQRRLQAATIYMSTLYPILHWHSHLPRPFSWFMEGDFVPLAGWVATVAGGLYVALLTAYVVTELWAISRGRSLHLPKQLVLLGTALSWYIGIVWAQGDMTFTAVNVVSHGIPYMALIWAYGRQKGGGVVWFRQAAIPLFVGLLVVLAYVEEGLWDAMVWYDHPQFFSWASGLPLLHDVAALSLLVPLLSVPQVTHYVLDGFIWRLRQDKQLQT